MRLRIAVTDNDWFRYLRNLPAVDEVNFWQPSGGRAFRALNPGELLLFKLHHPQNYIVGGGFFIRYLSLPYPFVWDAFGPKNGAPTLAEMKGRIEKYRRAPVGPNDPIGCILLRDPFFFDEFLWIETPPDFARNIVQGKTYEPDSATARELWEQIRTRLRVASRIEGRWSGMGMWFFWGELPTMTISSAPMRKAPRHSRFDLRSKSGVFPLKSALHKVPWAARRKPSFGE